MEAAIIKKYGSRIMKRLDTLKALVPQAHLQDEDFLREMQIGDASTLLSSFPQLFPGCHSESNLRSLREDHPEICAKLEQDARNAAQHRFDLLGSGLVDLGENIDWSLDFKSGKHWDCRNYRLQKLVDLRDESDVKVPWELSRCNHFPRMALACLLTNDHSFAIEFENQVISWRAENPFEHSINWTCAMETAFRCINWLVAYRMFSEHRRFSDDFAKVLLIELFKGGRFIWANLEHSATGFNSNHYLADLIGLLFVGTLFKTTPYGQEWLSFAQAEIEKEIEYQVTADGLDFESSLPYHGLVSEMMLYAHLFAKATERPFGEKFEGVFSEMLAHLVLFTQSDGTVAPIGDGDDGRLFRIFERHPRDFRDVIGIGQTLLGTTSHVYVGSLPERFLFGETELPKGEKEKPASLPSSFCYSEGGLCRLRSANLAVDFVVGGVGTAGLGNHKHNDILSFTLTCQGKPILIDPGTFVYSADEYWRNHFRSTASHNTVAVDGREQNRMIGGLLFMLRRDSHPEVMQWTSDDQHDFVVAENDGYCRLDDPVIHRRSLYLDKQTEVLLVRDELIAQGMHQIDFNFHCDQARITLLQHDLIQLQSADGEAGVLMSCCESRLKLGISTNWVSRSYGTKHAGIVVTGSVNTLLPFSALFAFTTQSGKDGLAVAELITGACQRAGW